MVLGGSSRRRVDDKHNPLSLSLSNSYLSPLDSLSLMASTRTEGSSEKRQENKTMETNKSEPRKSGANKGAWTNEEDRKLAEVIAIHGAKKWKTVAAEAGLNRCGKSCRLRWLNYLRPNIKRGNISDQEEDLILRLHKLLGNRWSLIAGRLPGRTDNEIKNYWNSHLSKRINQNEKQSEASKRRSVLEDGQKREVEEEDKEPSKMEFNVDDFFDLSNEESNLEWMSKFFEF